MFEEIIEKYSDYKIVYIEEVKKGLYNLFFSKDERLLFENLIKEEYDWKNYNIYSSVFEVEMPLVDKLPIEYVILEIEIPNSAGVKSLSETINKLSNNNSPQIPLTLDELFLNYESSLMGIFANNKQYYTEIHQGETLYTVFQKIKEIKQLNT